MPRWLSVWGLVAVPLVALSALLVMFRVIDNLSTPQVILALPIAVQEMVIAVWLIAKGFEPACYRCRRDVAAAGRIEHRDGGLGVGSVGSPPMRKSPFGRLRGFPS